MSPWEAFHLLRQKIVALFILSPKSLSLFLDAIHKVVLELKLIYTVFIVLILNQGPSTVSDIEISTNTTAATLKWQNSDEASPRYTYRLLIGKDGNSSHTAVTVTGVTSATVTGLIPGSSYTVEIFTQVGDVTESLAPGSQSFCTGEWPRVPLASFLCGAALAGRSSTVLSLSGFMWCARRDTELSETSC